MRKSHRKNVSMELEYGTEEAIRIKQQISDRVKESLLGDYIYQCSTCSKEFKSNRRLANKKKYCSKQCKTAGAFVMGPCCVCNKVVEKRTIAKNIFCSKKCYHKWQSENIAPPQSENRKQKANSPEAIEKKIKTMISNGYVARRDIFTEGMDFQQYTNIVRTLTKKLRKVIFASWDGYDHYESEKYIKNNFKLHYTDGDYPSIDHKISLVKAFNQGWSPEKVCDLTNLVVTTKRNNSRKNQRVYHEFKKQNKKTGV